MKLDSFRVKTYRGIRNLELNDFTDLNIFVGKNNSGKTSLMEAMVLSGICGNVEQFLATLISRYPKLNIDRIGTMFDVNDARRQIILEHSLCDERIGEHLQIHTDVIGTETTEHIQREENVRELRKLVLRIEYGAHSRNAQADQKEIFRIEFLQDGRSMSIRAGRKKNSDTIARVPCQYIAFSRFEEMRYLLRTLDEILEQGKRNELIEVLRIFDDKITNFEIIGDDRDIKIMRAGDVQPLSIYDYGNGMYKAFYIASAALLCEKGILLVDEIEAGIHREALERFVQYLRLLCREKQIQLFITTHSLETVDLFLHASEQADKIDELTVYNIRNTKEVTKARRYSGEKLKGLRTEIGMDVR